eukprot:TRINITY_DN15626_c0_g1_i1.p1 TRINITY_DN15626_c0_g1~~TRINITY_DN15626_c0_g1_i1.p1  ORF type:complete len:291 (-),score=74.17 TRINITY_DN15626_c0_g1_i1:23-895(-)
MTSPVPAEDVPLDIIFEDDQVLVLNKPAELSMHPSPAHCSGTVANALLFHIYQKTGLVGAPEIHREEDGGDGLITSYCHPPQTGIVHRLDINTSGLCVTAKTFSAAVELRRQFLGHLCQKEYMALCHGVPKESHFRCDCNITKAKKNNNGIKMRCVPADSGIGKIAVTEFELVERCGDHSLVRCLPHQGRTHQIRVHLATLGFPIVGDRLYGSAHAPLLVERAQETGAHAKKKHVRAWKPAFFETKRHMLHARRLRFSHPKTGEERVYEAGLPADFEAALQAARKSLRLF